MGYLKSLYQPVSTHSRPKAAGLVVCLVVCMIISFNTQPPEGGWVGYFGIALDSILFQHTAARRRLAGAFLLIPPVLRVSTHSRPKAAGRYPKSIQGQNPRFNTQPPEGGWDCDDAHCPTSCGFNTQPPEGGWLQPVAYRLGTGLFQHTAARRRLAITFNPSALIAIVSTHSRPKAAGRL